MIKIVVDTSNESIEKQVTRLLAGSKIIELTKQIAKFSGKLLRKELVKDVVDATVAATAVELGAQLATSNQKHFKKVRGIKLFMPLKPLA